MRAMASQNKGDKSRSMAGDVAAHGAEIAEIAGGPITWALEEMVHKNPTEDEVSLAQDIASTLFGEQVPRELQDAIHVAAVVDRVNRGLLDQGLWDHLEALPRGRAEILRDQCLDLLRIELLIQGCRDNRATRGRCPPSTTYHAAHFWADFRRAFEEHEGELGEAGRVFFKRVTAIPQELPPAMLSDLVTRYTPLELVRKLQKLCRALRRASFLHRVHQRCPNSSFWAPGRGVWTPAMETPAASASAAQGQRASGDGAGRGVARWDGAGQANAAGDGVAGDDVAQGAARPADDAAPSQRAAGGADYVRGEVAAAGRHAAPSPRVTRGKGKGGQSGEGDRGQIGGQSGVQMGAQSGGQSGGQRGGQSGGPTGGRIGGPRGGQTGRVPSNVVGSVAGHFRAGQGQAFAPAAGGVSSRHGAVGSGTGVDDMEDAGVREDADLEEGANVHDAADVDDDDDADFHDAVEAHDVGDLGDDADGHMGEGDKGWMGGGGVGSGQGAGAVRRMGETHGVDDAGGYQGGSQPGVWKTRRRDQGGKGHAPLLMQRSEAVASQRTGAPVPLGKSAAAPKGTGAASSQGCLRPLKGGPVSQGNGAASSQRKGKGEASAAEPVSARRSGRLVGRKPGYAEPVIPESDDDEEEEEWEEWEEQVEDGREAQGEEGEEEMEQNGANEHGFREANGEEGGEDGDEDWEEGEDDERGMRGKKLPMRDRVAATSKGLAALGRSGAARGPTMAPRGGTITPRGGTGNTASRADQGAGSAQVNDRRGVSAQDPFLVRDSQGEEGHHRKEGHTYCSRCNQAMDAVVAGNAGDGEGEWGFEGGEGDLEGGELLCADCTTRKASEDRKRKRTEALEAMLAPAAGPVLGGGGHERRVRWTDEETQVLRDVMREVLSRRGERDVIPWTEVRALGLRRGFFRNRREMQLKDRWRVLERNVG
eukprot:jgi/Mesvir1/25096/Mv21560-RA.1